MNEDDLIAATLHRAVSTLEPPTARLVAGGIARGRRRRRVVIGAEVLTGAALVAAVLAMVAVFLPGAPGGSGPAAASSAPSAESGTVPTTPQALLQTALDTLPRSGTTTGYSGSAGTGSVSAEFTYDDGRGGAAVIVALQYPVPGASVKESSPIVPCAAGDEGCAVLADGSHALIRQGHQYSDARQPNATEWSVDLVRADGVMISIFEYNAPQPKAAPISRAQPPFTTTQLVTWAASGAWQTAISRQRDLATGKLFQPNDPKPLISGAAASKRAAEIERATVDRAKAAKLARQQAECAVAKAAGHALPDFCATIK